MHWGVKVEVETDDEGGIEDVEVDLSAYYSPVNISSTLITSRPHIIHP